MSGTWATTPRSLSPARSSTPAVARCTGRLDGAPELVGDEREGDHGARQHGRRQVGQGKATRSVRVDVSAPPPTVGSLEVHAIDSIATRLWRLSEGGSALLLWRRTPARRPSSHRPARSRPYGITRRGQVDARAHRAAGRGGRTGPRSGARRGRRRPPGPVVVAVAGGAAEELDPVAGLVAPEERHRRVGSPGVPPPPRPAGCGRPRHPARRRWSSARRASPRRTARSASGRCRRRRRRRRAGGERGVADDAVADLETAAVQPAPSPGPTPMPTTTTSAGTSSSRRPVDAAVLELGDGDAAADVDALVGVARPSPPRPSRHRGRGSAAPAAPPAPSRRSREPCGRGDLEADEPGADDDDPGGAVGDLGAQARASRRACAARGPPPSPAWPGSRRGADPVARIESVERHRPSRRPARRRDRRRRGRSPARRGAGRARARRRRRAGAGRCGRAPTPRPAASWTAAAGRRAGAPRRRPA